MLNREKMERADGEKKITGIGIKRIYHCFCYFSIADTYMVLLWWWCIRLCTVCMCVGD